MSAPLFSEVFGRHPHVQACRHWQPLEAVFVLPDEGVELPEVGDTCLAANRRETPTDGGLADLQEIRYLLVVGTMVKGEHYSYLFSLEADQDLGHLDETENRPWES
jgi:hypothetical protein